MLVCGSGIVMAVEDGEYGRERSRGSWFMEGGGGKSTAMVRGMLNIISSGCSHFPFLFYSLLFTHWIPE